MPSPTPLTGAGIRMWNPDVQVLESRRMDLGNVPWQLTLCSPFWRLYVNHHSGAFIEHNGQKFSLRKGHLWIIPAWVRFQTGLTRTVIQDYIHFTFSGLPSFFLRRHFAHPISLRIPPALQPLIAQWQASFTWPVTPSHLCSAGAVVHAAMAGLLQDWEQMDARRWLAQTSEIREALDFLETSISRPVANRELARLCGMSEDHFIRRFRLLMGVPPAEYGRHQRIAAAAGWLTGTHRTLEDIAEAAGFTDRFHFSRVFKKRLGLTPAAYRRVHRLGG